MKTFTRKGYGRIYVEDAELIDSVKEIIKGLDEFEFEYLPHEFITSFTNYPALVYTHKFDGLDINLLTATCWKKGIKIWACDNGHEEFMSETAP